MKSLRLLFFVLAQIGLGVHPVSALSEFDCLESKKGVEKQGLLESIEQKYLSIKDLQAEFLQNSYFLGLNERKMSKGRLHFLKPGMMDWVYSEPDPQRFISDGETLWFYQPELNQVTVGQFKNSFSSDLPVSFLLGMGNLRENFKLDRACLSDTGLVVKLEPQIKDSSLNEFYLLIDKNTHSPLGARILDVGGNETSISFQKVILNSGIDRKQFEFQIPRGVDVIDNKAVAELNSLSVEKELPKKQLSEKTLIEEEGSREFVADSF